MVHAYVTKFFDFVGWVVLLTAMVGFGWMKISGRWWR
jgi:hypothetical protein